ncbi:nicotinate-nucleotide adenylyltransferase [Aestuariibacter salexigens]|uniref:nicotinate-nucleotide adenylyltransferase n=1 Tax=Aestuariibacter salexigens TaxID=226010 RepID=UPI0004250E32|nr:nicotinate-nucleotide adenylyltransferase [Aestuariibacter salexigens]
MKQLALPPIGVFGGTFNPPHYGHFCPVQDAARQVGIKRIMVVPCQIPPHKAKPETSAATRLTMVRLAAEHFNGFEVSDIELKRAGKSYTVDTLEQLRNDMPDTPICFFMGLDSLLHFDSWHRWQDIPKLSHIVVCARPGWQPDYNTNIQRLLEQRLTEAPAQLHRDKCGCLFFASVAPYHVSSTEIRQRLEKQQNLHGMMPDNVHAYINEHRLYRP